MKEPQPTLGDRYADQLPEPHRQALYAMAIEVLDHLFVDIETLAEQYKARTLEAMRSGADPTSVPMVTEADIEASMVLADLPDLYRHRYDELFAKRLLMSATALVNRLGDQHEVGSLLRCVADELLFDMLIERSKGYLVDLMEESEDGEFDLFAEVLLEDRDFEMLNDATRDDYVTFGGPPSLGLTPLRFEEWFKPFRPDEVVHPYNWE